MKRSKAFSYLRFSTPEQLRGDSFRRQKELAERYAVANGLELDDRSFQDLGVSAFRGRNASTGMLRVFLEAVEDGAIAKGSYLLVESLDRLSRAATRKALHQLEDICDAGIIVITLADGKRYDSESLDRDPTSLMMALLIMMRAHEESAMKSGRLKAVWESKRNLAKEKPVTARAPAWLRLDAARDTFHAIDDRATVVRRIYDLAVAGVGQHAIAAMLNREGVPPFGRGALWQRSYIAKILANPAVTGTFVPHTVEYVGGKRVRMPVEVVEGYFPVVVQSEIFDQVQAQRRGSKATRSESALNNLFAGLGRCPKCGSTMTRVNKGRGPKGGKPYLVCVEAKRGGGCFYRAVPQGYVEATFLAGISELTRDVPSTRFVATTELTATDRMLEQIEALIGGIDPKDTTRLVAYGGIRDQLLAQRAEESTRLSAAQGPTFVPRMRELLRECRKPQIDRRRVNALLRQLFAEVVIVYDVAPFMLEFQWHHGGRTPLFAAPKASEAA
jgi:DNA invertase Pin-like site-specific DNA recombinase